MCSAVARWRQTNRILLVFVVLSLIFLANRYRAALNETFHLPGLEHGRHEPAGEHDEAVRRDASMEHASNSTLGFHGIYYINMKARYDRADAASLQAYISGLDIQDYPAVEADMIDPVGMPPTHRPSVLKVGEKGCWRAHSNIWAEMVRKKLPPVLIMESDATWDINVRPIMSNLNKHFVEFLRHINSTAVHDPSWRAKNNHRPLADLHNTQQSEDSSNSPRDSPQAPPVPTTPPPIHYNADDPWLSEHWDLLSLGQCFEHSRDKEINLIYPDPSVPEGKDYWGRKLGHERAIRKSAGIVCTTAYAISHTGAAKLLMRSAVDLDNPVDLLIRRLTLSRDLVAYSVIPPVIAQWEYRNDVGMGERGAQSDINGGKHKDTPADAKMEGWDKVAKTGSVWITKAHHKDVVFDKMALDVAWEQIMGDAVLSDSWHDPQTGD
jgi:GR25 family glycosyltransferase involved in LPS biosynthesis